MSSSGNNNGFKKLTPIRMVCKGQIAKYFTPKVIYHEYCSSVSIPFIVYLRRRHFYDSTQPS
jgi:hypothetical protein